MNYGENLRNIRIRMGYTQVQLAKKLRITQTTISIYERGHCLISPSVYRKLRTLAKKEGIEVSIEEFRPM